MVAGTWVTVELGDARDPVLGGLQAQEPLGSQHGDLQELVFIGTDLDAAALRGALEWALLTPKETRAGAALWKRLDDPFPEWDRGIDPHSLHDH